MSTKGQVTPVPITDEPGVKGTLRISRYEATARSEAPLRHVSTYVNGPAYNGMEDNDLRGYLDGQFRWGWNQPGQVHVRLGRGDWSGPSPQYGEHELLRVIQRWDGISLPKGSRVLNCRLILTVEEGCKHPIRVVLYAVKKDWDPGTGGVDFDNSSPPKQGEVWWREVAFGETPWGLPGVGFASDEHPNADTDAVPLADALYEPGSAELVLSSARLASHTAERIAAQQPLLLLLKLSDFQEDIPGALLTVYSGNHGDSRHVSRRPHLILEWENAAEAESLECEVAVEHGRSFVLPRMNLGDDNPVAVSFSPEQGYDRPVVEVREGTAESISPWSRFDFPYRTSADWVQVKLVAATDPISLGRPFTAELKDTWVMTAPPEAQVVSVVFVSPTGLEHEANAEYRGRFTWAARFVPDEIGPWRYSWRYNFTGQPPVGPVGRFDVLGSDAETLSAHLEELAEQVRAARAASDPDHVARLRVRFTRLERAVMQQQTPESFRSASSSDLRQLLNHVRSSFCEKPLPEPIPLVAHGRPKTSKPGVWAALKRILRKMGVRRNPLSRLIRLVHQ